MKTIVKITESQLKNIIKESVKRIINESNIDNWCGCDNVHIIWHGEWADPELEANGTRANYYEVENTLWDNFVEITDDSQLDFNNQETKEQFAEWIRSNEDLVIETINDYGSNL